MPETASFGDLEDASTSETTTGNVLHRHRSATKRKEEAAAKVSGVRLLALQFVLLLRKNGAVLRRNARLTAIQLFIPLAMCFLLFVMSVDDKFNRSGFNRFTFADETPDVTAVGGLPTCDTYYMPECATPLAIVHDSTDAAADADSMAAVAEVTEQLLAANAQVRT